MTKSDIRYFQMTIFYKKPVLDPYTYPEPIPLTALPSKIFNYGGPNVSRIIIEDYPQPSLSGGVAQ